MNYASEFVLRLWSRLSDASSNIDFPDPWLIFILIGIIVLIILPFDDDKRR